MLKSVQGRLEGTVWKLMEIAIENGIMGILFLLSQRMLYDFYN